MSGGSFDYLYRSSYNEHSWYVDAVEQMATELFNLGHTAAAKEFEQLHRYLRRTELTLEVWHEQLSDVMHAVEWYKSSDYSKEEVAEAVAKLAERPSGGA